MTRDRADGPPMTRDSLRLDIDMHGLKTAEDCEIGTQHGCDGTHGTDFGS